MASQVINQHPFAPGTVVAVFPAENLPAGASSPSGSSVAGGTVDAAGALTVTGTFAAGRRYVVWSAGRGVSFRTDGVLERERAVRDRLAELEDRSLSAPVDVSVAGGTVPFSQPGSATIGASGAWRAPAAGTVTRATLSCVGAPAGSGLVVVAKRNGATFATLTIAAGSTTSDSETPAEAFSAGDLFTVESTSVGSGTAATGVVLQLDYETA